MTIITLEAAQAECCAEELQKFIEAHGLSGRESIGIGELLAILGRSTDEWRGKVAYYAPDLSANQRFELAMQSDAYWRGKMACHASDPSADQRVALAMASSARWRGKVARQAPDLSADQRQQLLDCSTLLTGGN